MKSILRTLSLGTALIISGLACRPALAEDPLLGEIKVIKCVGCQPGFVTLVIHDPIDVRDFEVLIPDGDYSKILTPLVGKRIYDPGQSCFYWMEMPKGAKPKGAKKPAKNPIKPNAIKDSTQGDDAKADPSADAAKEKSPTAAGAGMNEPANDNPEPTGTPSKCIPYTKLSGK